MKRFFGTTLKHRMKAHLCSAKLMPLAGLLLSCACVHGQSIPDNPATDAIPPAPSSTIATGAPPAPAPATVVAPPVTLPVATTIDTGDDNMVPMQAPVTPNVVHETVSSDDVFTVHLRPLFTTVVRLPEEVTSIAVGAPTLIDAEHNPAEPRLVDLKPTTYDKIDSNVVIALRSGHTLSIRVISGGEDDSSAGVDFVVDYAQPRSLFVPGQPTQSLPQSVESPRSTRREDNASPHRSDDGVSQPISHSKQGHHAVDTNLVNDNTPVADNDASGADITPDPPASLVDVLFREQQSIAAPHYVTAEELGKVYPEDEHASGDLVATLGRSVEEGDSIVVAYSVVNHSRHWVEVMPPTLLFNNPNTGKKGKVNKKNPDALAEQLIVSDYRMSRSKLAPGERLDGDVEFVRPGFKYRKEHLLLQIANASEVDAALLFPVPFVPAGR
jgi:hypothetical protein